MAQDQEPVTVDELRMLWAVATRERNDALNALYLCERQCKLIEEIFRVRGLQPRGL